MKKNLQIRKISGKEAVGWLFFGMALVMLINSIRLCFCNDIWYDELFTVGMAEHSYGELIHFTAKDVHPPLYYCIVKMVLDLCKLIIPSANSIIVMKLVSVLPYFFLLAYGLFFLRKKFGMLVTGLFLFSVLSMPQMSAYTVEMRMYSFALFFVTAAFFHAYSIVSEKGGGRHMIWRFHVRKTEVFLTFRWNGHFAALIFYGLAAAYTQYFACVAVMMVYAYLFLWFLVRRKHSRGQEQDAGRILRNLVICVAVSVLAYLPWLFVLVSQVTAVRENYWILPLTWRSLGGCVKFLTKPAFSHEWFNVLLAVVLFGIYVGLPAGYGFRIWRGRMVKDSLQEDEAGSRQSMVRLFYALAGCMVLCGLTAFGFIASILLRPIFVYRYMLPAMGCFWLCPVLCLDGLFPERRKVLFSCSFYLIIVVFAAIGIRDYRAFLGEEEYKAVLMKETELAISDIAGEDIILYNFDQMQAVMGYYLEQENYLWNGTPEPLILEIFGNKGSIESAEQIREWLDEGRTVWFLGSFNSREDIRAEWEKDGIQTEETGSYMLERYWFNIYSVFRE